MAIEIQSYALDYFETLRRNKTIEISPDIQRRPVWKKKSRVLLIDSIARRVPIGAITLYKDDSGKFIRYEVIDGKQRLGTLFDYLDGEFIVTEREVRKADEDELADIGVQLAEPLYDRKFSELDQDVSISLLQYRVPVFEVSGSRDQAVQAFTRMNTNSYVLNPQEIRNAVYAKSAFLDASVATASGFTDRLTTEAVSGFIALGIISDSEYTRMKDIQLASELLTLQLDGEQNRRDSLNSMYDQYGSPGTAATQKLEMAKAEVGKALDQIAEIFGEVPLQAYSFPPRCEHDLYALVGALLSRGIFSSSQMKKLREDLQATLGEFRRQVTVYVDDVEHERTLAVSRASDEVSKYARSFLRGQVNSESRRIERREALVAVLDDVADAPSRLSFSPQIRAMIWARSTDKICGRCGKEVEYDDFHAGHIVPKADGGLAVLENGRVEHSTCNQSAGAS